MFVLHHYSNLPEEIPIHYNGSGEVDAYGGKNNLFSLPIVATILIIGLYILNKFPHTFNYPSAITEENASRMYANATRLIRFLQVSVLILFFTITFQTIRVAEGQTDGLGNWFMLLVFALTFLPIFYFLIISSKQQ